MDVPQGHPHGADPRAFLEGVRPQIRAKLEEEIKALGGIKFQLALKVQLRKDNPDGSEEYTDPVLRHKQEAILQNSEIKGALNQAFPTIQETLEKWTQRGSGWVVDRVERDFRASLYKKYRRGANVVDGLDTGLSVASAAMAATGIGLLTTIIAAPVAIGLQAGAITCGLLGAGGRFICRKLEAKARKHDQIRVLALSKLNTIADRISTALTDGKISE